MIQLSLLAKNDLHWCLLLNLEVGSHPSLGLNAKWSTPAFSSIELAGAEWNGGGDQANEEGRAARPSA